ncbi:hypothetical protein D3C87_1795220 [compost metagenome]
MAPVVGLPGHPEMRARFEHGNRSADAFLGFKGFGGPDAAVFEIAQPGRQPFLGGHQLPGFGSWDRKGSRNPDLVTRRKRSQLPLARCLAVSERDFLPVPYAVDML